MYRLTMSDKTIHDQSAVSIRPHQISPISPETVVAIKCVEQEYNALREQLFNLRSCYVIQNPNTYLVSLDQLNNEEQQVKSEIEKL